MFTRSTFNFLESLSRNNNREWFEKNKSQYETLVRQPALEFIAAMAPHLAKIAPNFRAEPKKVGGSLMRVYRDTRFSHNKTPYKTNIGIQFRHALGKDVHAPGFYFHVSPEECFVGVGCWHPEPETLAQIRRRIAEYPDKWFAAKEDKKFIKQFVLEGDALSRPPKGYAAGHPAINDLKRKDFIGLSPLSENEVIGTGVVKIAKDRFVASVPLMSFLCDALNVKL
ncbi:MAG: DUF2461 domain-containing protein [Nitrosomonadales bacterium]